MSVLGAIIAGGKSQRFGGDKAAALIDDTALIDHVIGALAPQVNGLVIVGREWTAHPSIDDYPFSCGPLSGLCAALHFAKQYGHEYVLTVGCDVLPILPDLYSILVVGDGPAIIAGQRLLGRWPSALADALEAHIRLQPNYALRRWVEVSGAREVTPPVALYNINTAEDLISYSNMRQSA